MFRLLLLPFLIIPIIEIALFIHIGGAVGIVPTLLLIVVTAVAGVILWRIQGLATLVRVQESLSRGKIPAAEVLEGLVLLLAGAFLLTPGFFTDAVGFACLVPTVRCRAATWLLSRLNIQTFSHGFRPGGTDTESGTGTRQNPRTIEGQYERKD